MDVCRVAAVRARVYFACAELVSDYLYGCTGGFGDSSTGVLGCRATNLSVVVCCGGGWQAP